MSQLINTTNFDDFVKNATIKFRRAFNDFPKRASQLYDVEGTSIITGEESSIDGFSVAKLKEEGGDFAYLNVDQGYNKTWTVYEVGGMTKITWKMRVGMKYRDINNRINNLGRSAAKRMEWDLTHRFSYGHAATYSDIDGTTVATTVGDGFALFYASHRASAAYSGTFRNVVANNPLLSKGGIEAAEKLFATQMIDANGETIMEEPTHLIVSNDPNTVNTALEYLKSFGDPDGTHQGVYNVNKGKYTLIVLPYLATTGSTGAYDSDKAKYWMLANLSGTDAICKILQNPTFIPPTKNDGMEFETMDWKFACHEAYALEIVRPQWVVGSKGSGE